MQIKAFLHDKSNSNGSSDKGVFQKLNNRKSKWTPPDGQFATVDFFLQRCRHDVSKLKFNRESRSFNLKPDEWSALLNLSKRKDIAIKAANKGGTVVIWRTDLYQQENRLSTIGLYLDQIMSPFVKSIPAYIKDTNHGLKTFPDFNFPGQNKLIFTMDLTSLYTVIPNHERTPGTQILFSPTR